MTALCPRCSTPRAGDYPVCGRCGFDFRVETSAVVAPNSQAPYDMFDDDAIDIATITTAPAWTSQTPPEQSVARPGQVISAGPSLPAVCQRCRAPLYPGYTQCGNCGFDSAQVPPKVPTTPQYAPRPTYGAP